jgi:hypothetical protein
MSKRKGVSTTRPKLKLKPGFRRRPKPRLTKRQRELSLARANRLELKELFRQMALGDFIGCRD